MSLREAAQQALEALDAYSWEQVDAARAALRTALAEPERKPLTDEEVEAIRQVDDCGEDVPEFTRIFRIAERAHGIGGEA